MLAAADGQRFAASTFSFMRQGPALDAMRRLRAVGYGVIDAMAVPGHLWPSELTRGDRARLLRALRDEDIELESINPQPVDLNLGSALADVRAFSVRTYSEVLGLAADLGARGVVVVPGRVSPLLPPARHDTTRWTVDTVGALSDVATGLGIELWLENHPSAAFSTAEQVVELVDAIGRDDLKVAYDVANAEYLGEDQVRALALLGARLGQTHLSDTVPGRVAHDPFGRGSVDFDAILGELHRSGFQGANVVEIVSGDAVVDYRAAALELGIAAEPSAGPGQEPRSQRHSPS